MKFINLLFALFALNIVQAQHETNVKEQDGVTLSYEIQKAGSDKKGDKYMILTKAENKNDFDVYYTGAKAGSSSVSEGFGQFIVKNTHGFLAINVSYLKGQQTDLFTERAEQLYKLERGKIATGDFTVRVKSGDYPVVINTFNTSLKPLRFFSLRNNRKDDKRDSRDDRNYSDNSRHSNSTLFASQSLRSNDFLTSENHQYVLRLQQDGNLCVYKKKENGEEAFDWCSMSNGKHATSLRMQDDGNLVLYTSSDKPVWATNTSSYFDAKFNNARNKPVKLVLENSGRLVLVSATGQMVWSSR